MKEKKEKLRLQKRQETLAKKRKKSKNLKPDPKSTILLDSDHTIQTNY
jgi:hypothetical protein